MTGVNALRPSLKHCHGCERDKPRDAFAKCSSKRDGLQTQCRECKSKMNRDYAIRVPRSETLAAQKLERRRVAQEYVREYLQARACVDCGEGDWLVLEFDHVRGEKTKEVSLLVTSGYSLDRVKAEIDLCDVRCSNCHRRVTAARAGTWRTLF